jgi:opacity protein-like surface antigen
MKPKESVMKLRNSVTGVMFFFALGLLVSFSAPSYADDDDDVGDVSFGPRASYYMPEDGDETWSGGAQLRLWRDKPLSLEGSIDYRREKFGSTRVDVYPVQASLLLNFLPGQEFNVFGLGGAGWYYTHIDRAGALDDDTDHRFGFHAGAGLEFMLGSGWSIDGTYRYIWLEDFASEDASIEDKDFDDSGSQVTIGLNYHF